MYLSPQKACGEAVNDRRIDRRDFPGTNLGAYDIESFSLSSTLHNVQFSGWGDRLKPFALGGGVSARPATMLTLVFDHRIVDGVPAAKFLQDLKLYLKIPDSLL